MELSEKAKSLYQAYVDVEKTGDRLGFLKEELGPVAQELIDAGKLVNGSIKGIYKLPSKEE